MNTNTTTSFSSYESWLRHHGCFELSNMHNQGDLLCQGVMSDVLMEQYRLPLCAGIVERAFEKARLMEVWNVPESKKTETL